MRFDHVVQPTVSSGDVWVSKFGFVFPDQSLANVLFFLVRNGPNLSSMDDVDGTLGPHDGQFSGWPSNVVIALQVLARHGQVCAAVGLSCDQGEFGDGGFGVGEQKFGAVADDATPFLDHAGKEAGNVFKGQKRDVERIAGSDESGCFDGGIDVQTTRQYLWLITDHTHRGAVHSCKTDDDVVGIGGEQFHEKPVVNHFLDHLHHVIGLVWVVGHHVLKRFIEASDGVCSGQNGRVSHVVVGQIGKNGGRQFASILFIVSDQGSNARP